MPVGVATPANGDRGFEREAGSGECNRFRVALEGGAVKDASVADVETEVTAVA